MALTCKNISAPGRIRTCDTGFRRAVLYPLSYEGEGRLWIRIWLVRVYRVRCEPRRRGGG
jgi:hypothetical protein